jgi:hypothetical protein
VELEFDGPIFHWRGPAPHHFVAVPEAESELLQEFSHLSYGWGCLPVRGRIGATEFDTSLMPKDGLFLLPVKVAVRRAENLELGDRVTVRLELETD